MRRVHKKKRKASVLCVKRSEARDCISGKSGGSRGRKCVLGVSANIFALLIFILIMMLAAQERPVVRSESGLVVDIEKDLDGLERSPLGSDELFDLLKQIFIAERLRQNLAIGELRRKVGIGRSGGVQQMNVAGHR